MLSPALIADAAACTQALEALSEDTTLSVYFKQGGLALVPSNGCDDVAIINACKPLADTLHSGSHTLRVVAGAEVEGPKDTWNPPASGGGVPHISLAGGMNVNPRAEGAGVYTLLFARSPTVQLACVAQSEAMRAEWMAVTDLPNALANAASSISLLEMEMDQGQILFMAPSMPWLLKEGLVQAYTLFVETAKPKPMKPKTYEECVAKLASLKERIARLDKRTWNPQGANAKAIEAFEAMPADQFDKKKIENAARSLGTLEGRIHDAEHDTVLPGVLAELEEVRVYLDTKMSNVAPKTQQSRRKRYEELLNTEYNLVAKAKAVHDLLIEVRGLSEGMSTPKLRTDVSRPNGASMIAAAASAAAAIVVPEIDAGTLSPYIIDHADGPDGYKAVVGSIHKDNKANFQTMTQALKHDGVSALYQKWLDEAKKVNEQTQAALRDPSLSVDVTLYVAYADALKKVYEDTKGGLSIAPGSAGGNGGLSVVLVPPAAGQGQKSSAAKTVKCSECEQRRKEFDGTGMCKGCYQEHTVAPSIEKLEERADLLHRQMKREADENGPLHALYDEFVPVNEKLGKAFQAFEPPNAPASAWEKLKLLMKQADDMLPGKKLSAPRGEGDEDGDDEEEDFDSDDADAIVLHSDEESASFSDEPKKRLKKRERDESSSSGDEGNGLAHRALETLYRLPVATVHESILENYHNKRYVLVEEELKRLDEVKEVYGFTVQAIRKEGEDDEPEEWHTFFLKRNEAAKLANSTAVPDKIRTKVITKRVRDEQEQGEAPANKEAKKEEENNEDE